MKFAIRQPVLKRVGFSLNYKNFFFLNNTIKKISVSTANFYLENMNPDVDPCDDFYQFACGNFIKNTPIPADENKISPIKIIQKKVYSELIREMEKKINPAEPSAFRKTKKFYQNCINERNSLYVMDKLDLA